MLQMRKEGSKEEFLYYLYNKLGYTDLELAYNYEIDGDLCFSKWIKYHTLMHLKNNEIVPNLKESMSKREFIKRASHRRILDIEILLDIDDNKVGYYTYPTVKAKVEHIVKELKKLGANPVIYSTGGKGYHISVLVPKLRFKNKLERQYIKSKILNHYGADTQKAGDRVLISLEGVKHWRSGKIKKEVKL